MASRNQKIPEKIQAVDIQKCLEEPVSATNPVPVDIKPATGETPISVADGSDKAQGSLTDVAVAAGASGTISAKLRRMSADIATIAGYLQDGSQKTQLYYSDGTTAVDIQNPLPVDGDSLYAKDIDLAHSTKVGWTGNIIDLFDCPNDATGIYNDTVTNPKLLYIAFCRTVYLNAIGIGSNLAGKTFSNAKIEFIGSDGTVRATYDDSADATKYGTKLYSFAPVACIAIRFSFLTANTDIGLSNITIQKENAVIARIRGIDEDTGEVGDITTSGGDFNVLARLRNATGNVKINPATSTIQTDGTQIARITARTGASTYQVPLIDVATHVIKTIDNAHSEIHDGDAFFRKDWLDLTNGQVYDILCVTPDTARYAHIVVEFASELESNIKVYEGATASNNGTAITVFNRNRNSATNSTTLLYHTPTVAGGAEGTNIANYKIGSSRAVGGNEGSRLEIILKRNTKYLIRITNDTANANWFAFLADWYEHTNLTA
jgi:hypothetical protein